MNSGYIIIYPVSVMAIGSVLFIVLAIIKTLIEGSAQAICHFANNYTWLVLLIIAVIIIAIIICIAKSSEDKRESLFSISSGISAFLALSLVYAELIYFMVEFAEATEEIFIIALIMSPVVLFFMIIQMALTLLLCAITFIPHCCIDELSDKATSIIFTICTIVSNSALIFFFSTSQLPKFILSSLR